MAFIDIFNFKKYFATPSDAQVARYGHVNALYTSLKITNGQYTLPTSESDQTVTTLSGTIAVTDVVTDASTNFNITSTDILATSTVFINIASDANPGAVSFVVSDVTNGNIALKVIGPHAGATISIHYLIIN